jgi:hypothetical protein
VKGAAIVGAKEEVAHLPGQAVTAAQAGNVAAKTTDKVLSGWDLVKMLEDLLKTKP